MTKDQVILEIVQGYNIPFISYPKQSKPPRVITMSKEETKWVDQEIQEMLRKGGGGLFLDKEITRSIFKHSVFSREKR